MSIWSPYAKGNGQWIARNIVMGFIAAPIEALPQTSITDIYFAHERGTYLGWYAWTLASSNYFAPLITGFINDGIGYRWPFFLMAIFAAVSFVYLFLFLEETNYERSTVGVVYADGNDTAVSGTPTKDKEQCDAGVVQAGDSATTLRGKEPSFLQKLSISVKPRPFLMHWRAWQILKFVSWPVVFYAGFSYGTYLIWFNILNATASIILGGAPYHFKPSIVGLSYLACMLGVIAGCVSSVLY